MPSTPETLQSINEALARIRKFRPLWKQEYSLDTVLSLDEIEAFEQSYSCRLPEEYRLFLLHAGNGGAGPDCGVFALGQHFPDSDHEECQGEDVDLSRFFPHMDAWNEEPGTPEFEEDDKYFSHVHVAGSMLLGDRGCSLSTRIIITGPLAGEIWHDSRADGEGLHPSLQADGSRHTFLSWYTDWLARSLHQFGHQGTPNPDPGAGAVKLT